MRALVTGGAGFIGSTLVDRLLAEGHQVDVVDDLSTGSLVNLAAARADRSYELKIHRLDLRDDTSVDLIERQAPEVIFHLAAQSAVPASIADPVLDATVNVIGSLNVLEGARRAGTTKVVFASSGGTIYGEPDPADLPVKESQPQRPLSPSGVAKKAVGDYLHAYREVHELEYTALALGSVYGPRQDPGGPVGVVATFAAHLLAGEPCTIHGDGAQTRDFVHVDDAVDAFARAAERGGGLLINIGTGVETSVNQLYATVAEVVGVDLPAVQAPGRPGEPARIALDNARAAVQLGWRPWTDLHAGVATVVDHLRASR